MEDLRALFRSGRPEGSAVALLEDGAWTFGAFSRAAGAARTRAARGGRWLLACEDPCAFAAGFMGLALAGATLVLPPNLLPDTLGGLEADGLLRDADLAQAGAPAPALAVADTPVEFWTSGSAGDPKRVVRSFDQMAREVALLETLFGHLLEGAAIAATVPHHHIYGCLFRILWPLAANRPFFQRTCGDPARFRADLAGRPALVSSPAHLARLPRMLDLHGLHLPAVFSSGGALEHDDALAWRAASASGVQEVYGSTESGGVGWRNPGPGPASALWTPFPDVTLATAADGAILLRSSRVDPAGLRLEDAAELTPDGRFSLKGRLDRVVKIDEKRVSLPQVEAALRAHPSVRDAAVVVLEGRRRLLGAAIVPAQDLPGDAAARRAFGDRLRDHLASAFEASAIPRRWRFLADLPRDARGKLQPATLAGLFEGRGRSGNQPF